MRHPDGLMQERLGLSNESYAAFPEKPPRHNPVKDPRDWDSTQYVDRTMIVAMIAMRVMQMAVNQIIDVVPMGYRFMTTSWAVYMSGFMTIALMAWCALVRCGVGNLNHMFVDMILVRMMQMTIMKIVDMAIVVYGCMPAVGAVLMFVVWMLLTRHDNLQRSCQYVPLNVVHPAGPCKRSPNSLIQMSIAMLSICLRSTLLIRFGP